MENDQIQESIFTEKLIAYEYIEISKNTGIERKEMHGSIKTNVKMRENNIVMNEIKCFDFESYVEYLRDIRIENELKKNRSSSLDIDKLVAKIDKKIQELEEEEKKNKQ